MREFTKSYLKIMELLSLILGILCCITIVGVVIGVPLLISYKKFKQAANGDDTTLIQLRRTLFGWGIFNAIILAPSIIGCIIVFIIVYQVNKYILDLENGNVENTIKTFGESLKDSATNAVAETKSIFNVKSKLDKEQEQLVKLKSLKDEGLLTEEEYEAKRRQILKID